MQDGDSVRAVIESLEAFREDEEERIEESLQEQLKQLRVPVFCRKATHADERYLEGIEACIAKLKQDME